MSMEPTPPPKKAKKNSIRFSSSVTVDDGTAAPGSSGNINNAVGGGRAAKDVSQYPASYDRRLALTNRLPARSTPYVGLYNQGATCYMNALLQTLYITPEFTYFLLNFVFPVEQQTASNMLYQLQLLFSHLLGGTASAVNTKGLTAAFGWKEQDSAVQQDVQELNRVLFDAIQKCIDHASLPRHTQFLSVFFEGECADFAICMECNTTRTRLEKFQDASLAIRGCATLADCFDKYLVVETMDGANKVTCDKCGGPRDTKKGLTFKSFPIIFTIQLRRIDFNLTTMRREKLDDKIQIPLEIDLARWQMEAVRSGPLWYDVAAVMVHRGTAYHGHYFVYVRSGTKWFKFDDESVSLAPEEEISDVLDPKVVEAATVVFGPQPEGDTTDDFITNLFDDAPPVATTTPNIFGDMFNEQAPSKKGGRKVVPGQSYYTVYRRRGEEHSYVPSVPESVQPLLDAANAEHAALLAEFAHLSTLCEVGVFHENKKTWVAPASHCTVTGLTALVRASLRLDVPSPSHIRLREYNILLGVAGKSYENESATLAEIGFKPIQRTVCVEVRADASVPWRTHTGDDTKLFVHAFDATQRVFGAQEKIAVSDDATVAELKSVLEGQFGIPSSLQIIVWKSRDAPVVISEDDTKILKRDYKMDFGDVIYVESVNDAARIDEEDDTLINAVNHIQSANKCMVLYSVGDDELSALRFDSRKTFLDLKNALSGECGIPGTDLVLRWHGGREIRDLSVRLGPYVTADCITLVLTRGRPMAADEFRIHFVRPGHMKKPFFTREYRGVVATETVHQDVADALGLASKSFVRIRVSSTLKGSGCGDLLQVFATVGELMKGPVLTSMVMICNEAVLVAMPMACAELLTKSSLLLTVQPACLVVSDAFEFLTSQEIAVTKTMTWKEFFDLLSGLYGWPTDRIVVGKIKAMDLGDPSRWPTVLKNCSQLTSGIEAKRLVYTPFYLDNDDLVLVFDGSGRTFALAEPRAMRKDAKKPSPLKKGKGALKATEATRERGIVIHTEWDQRPTEENREPDLEDDKDTKATDPPVDDGSAGGAMDPQQDEKSPAEGGVLANVPTVLYTDIHAQLDAAKECTICRSDFELGEECLLLPCYHIFHKACVETWLLEHATCPICVRCVM